MLLFLSRDRSDIVTLGGSDVTDPARRSTGNRQLRSQDSTGGGARHPRADGQHIELDDPVHLQRLRWTARHGRALQSWRRTVWTLSGLRAVVLLRRAIRVGLSVRNQH